MNAILVPSKGELALNELGHNVSSSFFSELIWEKGRGISKTKVEKNRIYGMFFFMLS
jgi:hypothetical protein